MILVCLALGALAMPPTAIPFDRSWEVSPGSYEGEFAEPPVPHWRVRLPGGVVNSATHAERAAPVLAGDSIFLGAAGGGGLYELARADGRLVRTYPASDAVESAPVVTQEHLFFSDVTGVTYCYRRDGQRVWEYPSRAPILVEPVLWGDLVLVATVDDRVLALEAATGTLSWRYQAPKNLSRQAELALYAAPAPLVLDGQALAGFSDGSLVALDATTGEEKWRREVGEGRYPDLVAPVVAAGSDLLASGYFQPLLALDARSRSVRWRVEAGAAAGPLVALDDQKVRTIYHPGSDGRLRAIAALTGAERWVWESGSSGALTTPVATPAGLVVASSDGGVFLIDAQSGVEQWRVHLPERLIGLSARPAVDGRQLVFVTNAGFLYSFLSPR